MTYTNRYNKIMNIKKWSRGMWVNFICWLNRNKPQKMFMCISDFNFDGFMDINKVKIDDVELLRIYKLKKIAHVKK